MSKKTKKQKKGYAKHQKQELRKRVQHLHTGETASADAATVGWMITCLATIVALLGAAGAWVLAQWVAEENFFRPLAAVMLFIALVCGIVSICVTPVVLRVRKEPPPRPIVIGVLAIGLLPILIALATMV